MGIRCVQNLRFTQPFVTYLSHSTQINTISFYEPCASVHSALMDTLVKWARSHFNEVCYLAPSRSFPQGCPLLGSQKASSLLREAGAVSRTQPLIHFFSINLCFIWPLLTRILCRGSTNVRRAPPAPHLPHPNQPKSSAEEAWGICQKY